MCYLESKCKKFHDGLCNKNEFCHMKFKVDKLFDLGLISETQRIRIGLHPDANGVDEDKFQQLASIQRNIEEFVARGTNLYLYSNRTGNGKTAWSLRLAQEYINKIWYKTDISCKVLFVDVSRFLLALKNNISNKDDYAIYIKEHVIDADLVIWDDIATKAATEYEMENLLSFINTRINCGKSNIFTSNVLPQNLATMVGERLCSRLIGMSTQIQLNGSDKRGTNN